MSRPAWLTDNLLLGFIAGGILILGTGILTGYLIGHKHSSVGEQASDSSSALNVSAQPVTATTATTPAFTPIDLNGTGQQATKTVQLPTGGYKSTITYSGAEDNFTVYLIDDQGKELDLLANEVGTTANVSKVFNVVGGTYSFNVRGGGDWTIKIEALR